jgi:hypothetical protein
MFESKNLLVSFSGGETSAFMGQWLLKNYKRYGYEEILFVFANTGLENEQTLEFVNRCDKHFRFNTHWVESKVIHEANKGTRYNVVDFDSASRDGEPFEDVISKYGIPNQAFPHCTRELKQAPISSFAKDYFGSEKWHTAIGIRIDEVDRISSAAKTNGYIYPLISSKMLPTKKPVINLYWRDMPFRLELKGYQGNCLTCWKKGDNKLFQIYHENNKSFGFMTRMEEQYPRIGFEFEKEYEIDENGNQFIPIDRTFFRKNRSAIEMIELAKQWKGTIIDDSKKYDYQADLFFDLVGGDGESCEVFSECSPAE